MTNGNELPPFPEDAMTLSRQRNSRFDTPYDPLSGLGCEGRRVEVSAAAIGTSNIPVSMTIDPDFFAASRNINMWERLRCRHDFEFWCARCVKIKDKLTGRHIPFVLNLPQRKVLAVLEDDRRHRRPMRIIMLKARQWGGSTLVQMYMAWIQLTQCQNWHSLICAHLKDSAKNILGMYTTLIDNYPKELCDDDTPFAFKPFERSTNIRRIVGRDCRVTVSSAESQEALRGADIAMAHLSETAFWPETTQKSPADFMRTVTGTIALEPLTLLVMESTANGTGNFFHDEWQRCVAGEGDKHPVFVPWYDIAIYRKSLCDEDEARRLWSTMTPYEYSLWFDKQLSLEQINWYHHKSREYPSPDGMHAEFPTTPDEAFVNGGANVFAAADIERLRKSCRQPSTRHEVSSDGEIYPCHNGRLSIWDDADPAKSYIVTVDVGGRSDKADFSVIAVFERTKPLRVVAQWRGHCDHDILASRAITIARRYNNALLVIESNTLETERIDTSGVGVLDDVRQRYANLYCRTGDDNTAGTPRLRPGFHTNRNTKSVMIDLLIKTVRHGYDERDNEACNELAAYVCYPNGSYGARPGKHDDILMTRAMAVYILNRVPPKIDNSSLSSLAKPYIVW